MIIYEGTDILVSGAFLKCVSIVWLFGLYTSSKHFQTKLFRFILE